MRRFGLCEEKGSGIDKVIKYIELHQLPAPEFRAEYQRTCAIIFEPKEFADMEIGERIRACYQHCVLQWVLKQPMNNQSLRNRFGLV